MTALLKRLPYIGIALGVASGVAIYFTVSAMRARADKERFLNTYEGQPIPEEGLARNPAGVNKGDPENAYRDLRRIYGALTAFRARHSRLPKTPWELLEAGKRGEVDLKNEDYINPDVAHTDNETLQKELKAGKEIGLNQSYGFEFCGPMPDGKPVPVFPPEDKPVVWASSSSYERDNARVHRGLKNTHKLEGFTIFLWSNGRITRRNRGEKLMVRESKNSWRPFNPAYEKPDGREVISEIEFYRRLEQDKLFGK